MQRGNQNQHSPKMVTCWQHTKTDINFNDLDKHKWGNQMSYPYPYYLLLFEIYQEWFDADWKSLIQCVWGLQNECVYMELSYATPYQQYDNVLDYLSKDFIQQANNIWHELLDIRLALLCGEDPSTLLRLQWYQHGPTKCVLQNCPLDSPPKLIRSYLCKVYSSLWPNFFCSWSSRFWWSSHPQPPGFGPN